MIPSNIRPDQKFKMDMVSILYGLKSIVGNLKNIYLDVLVTKLQAICTQSKLKKIGFLANS